MLNTFAFERVRIYSVVYTNSWGLQIPTETEIYNWPCHYYTAQKSNQKQSDLWLNTNEARLDVVVDKYINNISKWDYVEVFDANGDKYWDYKVTIINKNPTITGAISNTFFTIEPSDGKDT